MDTLHNLARGLSPSWHIAKNGGGGSLGSFIRHTNPMFKYQQKSFDREKEPERQAAATQLLQRRQMMDADNQRRQLAQEQADIASPSRLRRRGRGLVQYLGA
jgi:hypothetical protein